MLIDIHLPAYRDASPALNDAIPQLQIADSQPLRVVPTPPPHIADSQPPPVAPSPPSQFNGPPPVRKTPLQLISIQLPDLINTNNFKLINKSHRPPSNRRQNRNVNPLRSFDDYHLGAVIEKCNDVSSDSNYWSGDDLTIGNSYPDYGPTSFSAPLHVTSASATAFLPKQWQSCQPLRPPL